MSTPVSTALNAYNSAAGLMKDPTKAPGLGGGGGEGQDFAKMVTDAVQSTIDKGNQADKMSMQMLNGNANVVDVVTAVSESELAVQSMVAVRDRVISAYEEIMRMPI